MIHCQNCGQGNENSVNFCRFCGNRITTPQIHTQAQAETIAPRPYMWKTDEFQLDKSARSTQEIKQFHPAAANSVQTQALGYPQPTFLAAGYRCPRCGSQNPPITKRQISSAGWITFAVLLVMTGILFWIGLLIKEDVKVCPVCNYKIS